MSHWNYRVVREKYTHSDGEVETSYAIYEVYYDDNGNPLARSAYGATFLWCEGESKWGCLYKFIRALWMPIINDEDFPKS